MERWLEKRAALLHQGDVSDDASLDDMLREIQSVEKLLELQDATVRQLKTRAV